MKQKETDRVTKQVSGQAAEARQKGQQKSATIRDEDPKRAKAQQDAVQALAEQQAADIESTLPKITASITDDTAHLADGFVSHATEIAAQFQEAVTRTNSSVTDLIATACRQMDAAASQAITILDQIRTTIIGQVNALERQFMSVLARLPQTAMDGIAANEKASLDNIDATTRDSVAGLNESAVQCITADKGIAHLPPELNRISANASKGFEAVHNTNGKQLDAIDQHFREKTAGLESQLGTGLDKAKGQAGEVGGKITGQMTGGFGFVLQNTRQTVAVMAGQLLAGFSKKGDDTISELKTSFEKGKATVLKAANDSLHENDQALSQLDGKLTKAAEKAADEYDTPAWKRALISIGKVAIGLILSIVATYVIAAVIFVGGLLLVGLGIISGITFATALLIAMVVVAVGFVAYEFITRLEEYKAEHGPIGSFWKALGVSFALLGISIASLTGIPSIIEGLRGHKFFSDRELSTQERYDMVIGGFVQALLLFTGFRAAKAAREGKTPGGIPRFFERVNREIEFRLKQWIGEKGKPPIPKGDPPQPRVPDPDEVPHPAMSEELKAIRASLKDRKAIEQFDYMYEGKKYNNAGMERLIKSITEGLTKKKGGGTLEDELIQRWNYRFAKPSGESLPEVGPLLSRAETLLGEVEAFSAKNKIDMPDIKKQLAADIKLLEEMQNGTKVAAKDSVDGARAHIDGEEAELNEARDSKGLKASGAKVKLGTGEVDVDIVWDNGRQWTEVKSGDSFGLDSGHWVSKDGNDGLKPQLIRLLAAAKANPVDGKPPRITVSFTKGVGPDVAKAINDMGINVKGNKVMPLIICHGDDPCGDDSTIKKKAETDQDGHYTGNYIFDPGHDGLNASFFNQVKKDVARGPLDDTAIEALRTDAIRRNGTVMHAELLLMAAMRNPVNVTLMHAHHAGPLVIPMSQIKKSDEDYLTNFGRDAVPADIVDLDLRLLAAAMGFSTENIDALIDKLDTRAQEQIKLYAGRQFSDLADKLIIDAGSDPKIPLTEILTAMVNGASDSTPGDRIMAGSVYDVAKKANHPMASQILSGALKVDALIPRVYPRIAPNSEAQYVYSTDSDVEKSDTLYVQTSMDIFKLRHRALIIHELTHAADDFAASNTRQDDSLFLETHAYKEQGRYMMDQILGDAPNKPEGWFNAAASYAKDSKLYYWSMVAAAKDNESRYKDVLVEINTHAPMSMDAARVRADLAMSVADLDAKVRTELLAYRDAAGHAAYSAGTTRLEGQKGQYFHKD
jgi:hypothetical protein